MKKANKITTLFLDVGGVLLTDGWDRESRKRAAVLFKVDHLAMEKRHHMVFEVYEEGKLSLEKYLDMVVFYRERTFSHDQFKDFMFEQSLPFTNMIALIAAIKKLYGLKVGVVSNEARELNEFRIQKFGLNQLADFFISSSFVHLRKPDPDIFRLALDIAQVPAENILFMDDQALFVSIANGFGMKAIHHIDFTSTARKLQSFGLGLPESLLSKILPQND